jgi:arginase
MAGIKMARPKSKLGVIWIDAHADLHTPFTTPSGNVHGMPLAAALDEDNAEDAVHQLDDETIKYWNQLKNMVRLRLRFCPRTWFLFRCAITRKKKNT